MHIDIDRVVGLVVDPKHNRYGQLCAIEWHDWREFGIYRVRFADGKSEEISDGLCKGDSSSPAKLFFRHVNPLTQYYESEGIAGVNNLKQEFLGLKVGAFLEFLCILLCQFCLLFFWKNFICLLPY